MENENYITIQGFMRNELGLSGNDLIVYAIIYGYSQNGQGKFTGSAQYLADWCGSTKRGIYKNLNGLVERGLIIKDEVERNGIKFCDYRVSQFTPSELSSVGSELSSPHNIDNNIDKKSISTNVDIPKDKIPYEEIIDYLNKATGKKYKATSKTTQKHIKARWNEGFTFDDFKRVIDIKSKAWGNDPRMEMYLRPETLFGTKFEGYLNEGNKNQKLITSAPKKSVDEIRKEIYGS